ncbi:hypothetical protein [Accumulibacter sp.]|nr:hypothetical protein [Accumulibacter sp.]
MVHTTDGRHALPIADNLLNRQFEPARANCAWVSDIRKAVPWCPRR